MICDADTIGVFQIESRAQMSMLPRLRPRVLRPGGTGGHRAAGADPGRHGASLPAPTPGARKTKPIPAKRCATCSRAPWACRSSRNRSCRSPWWRPASRPATPISCAAHGRLEAQGRRRQIPRQAGRRPAGPRLRWTSPKRCSARSRASANTAFPKATPPASRAAGLRQLLAQAPRARGLPGRPAQFPAHGLRAPAQLVQDARRHGVRVLPPDVMHSGWDSALETPPPEALATRAAPIPTRRPPASRAPPCAWA